MSSQSFLEKWLRKSQLEMVDILEIIRTGYRLGDNAEMCMIELVDFNEVYTKETATKNDKKIA